METVQKTFGLDDAAMTTLKKAMEEHNLTTTDVRNSSYVQVFHETPQQFAERELEENPNAWENQEEIFEELKTDCYHIGADYIVLIVR